MTSSSLSATTSTTISCDQQTNVSSYAFQRLRRHCPRHVRGLARVQGAVRDPQAECDSRLSVVLSELLLERTNAGQSLVPTSFQLAGNQSVVRIDLVILTMRAGSLEPCLLKRILKLLPLLQSFLAHDHSWRRSAASMPSGCSRSRTSWATARSIRTPPNERQLLSDPIVKAPDKRSAASDRPWRCMRPSASSHSERTGKDRPAGPRPAGSSRDPCCSSGWRCRQSGADSVQTPPTRYIPHGGP